MTEQIGAMFMQLQSDGMSPLSAKQIASALLPSELCTVRRAQAAHHLNSSYSLDSDCSPHGPRHEPPVLSSVSMARSKPVVEDCWFSSKSITCGAHQRITGRDKILHRYAAVATGSPAESHLLKALALHPSGPLMFAGSHG